MYQKHLIECQCTLSIFKNNTQPVYHKIPVVSFFDVNNDLKEKYVICNNCGIIHRVYELLKSEIKWGIEDLKSLVNTKEDIEQNLNFLGKESIVNLLNKENVDVSIWELAEYIIEHNLSDTIVLQRTESDNNIVYKLLEIKDGRHRIKKEVQQRYLWIL